MRPIRRILVALKDPTLASLPGVIKGAQLARAFEAKLDLFHALEPPICTDGGDPETAGHPGMLFRVRSQRLEQLERLAIAVRAQGIKVSLAAEWDSAPSTAILRRATRIGADLIVAEFPPSRRHFTCRWLYPTDWQLLRHSGTPVLMVKTPGPYRRPIVLAAIDPSRARAKSWTLDEQILKTAAAFRSGLQGRLHAVHAYQPVAASLVPQGFISSDLAVSCVTQSEATARARFTRALQQAGIPLGQGHLIALPPREAITTAAQDVGCALVVIGAVSQSGLNGWLIGNTAEAILTELPCDVLIVKDRRVTQPRRMRADASLRLAQPLY